MGNYNHLKQIREIYGITQEALAKAVDINRSTISQWENGVFIASSFGLEKLANFFGIGVDSFYEIPEIDDETREKLVKSANIAQENKLEEAQVKIYNPMINKRETVKEYQDGKLIKKTITEYFT